MNKGMIIMLQLSFLELALITNGTTNCIPIFLSFFDVRNDVSIKLTYIYTKSHINDSHQNLTLFSSLLYS